MTVRHFLYGLYGGLLILGMVAIGHLLLTDLQGRIARSALPVAGERVARGTPITQGPSMDGFGAWSPDGREIAFMRDGQIMLTDPSGKRVQPLTSEPDAWDAAPAWRPDGKAIAFARLSMDGDQARIMLVEPGKGKAREIHREPGPVGYLAWGPDGRSLFYSTRDRLVRLDLAGQRAEQVYAPPRGWEMLSGGLAVTRGGQLIFGAGPRMAEGVEYDLYVLTPGQKGDPKRLTTDGGIMPALDPTGHLVAYRNPRRGQETGIYLLNLATGQRHLIVPDEPRAMYFHPAFSPDGRRLVLSRLLLVPPQSRGRGGFTSHLYLHTLEGSGRDR
jgi:Tol biopolymer transport system component